MSDTAYIKLSDLPDDLGPRMNVFLEKHNVLTGEVVLIKEELETITGKTPEEKEEMKQAWTLIRPIIHWVKTKGLVGLGAGWLLLQILQGLGFQTKGLAPMVQTIIGQ